MKRFERSRNGHLYTNMTTFEYIFNKTMSHEGYYANVAQDRGGETYRGIARKYWPNWEGWKIVDQEKRNNGGSLPHNYRIVDATLDKLVLSFFKTHYWEKPLFDKVRDKQLAGLLFDFYVNSSSSAIRVVQDTLNKHFGQMLKVDGVMGNNTLAAINAVNGYMLFNQLVEERKAFYQRIVAANPSQSVFLKGWLARAQSYAYESISGLLILTAGAAFYWFKYR
ncbi:glycosyl hydrolase 108 family protein [Limibacter armeniacum]|uniref:glycoside hydrolase family 108 protein n=1 Tax=Limibacter armeniacum TaxID=466084 RepID=UPI002FE6BD76